MEGLPARVASRFMGRVAGLMDLRRAIGQARANVRSLGGVWYVNSTSDGIRVERTPVKEGWAGNSTLAKVDESGVKLVRGACRRRADVGDVSLVFELFWFIQGVGGGGLSLEQRQKAEAILSRAVVEEQDAMYVLVRRRLHSRVYGERLAAVGLRAQ